MSPLILSGLLGSAALPPQSIAESAIAKLQADASVLLGATSPVSEEPASAPASSPSDIAPVKFALADLDRLPVQSGREASATSAAATMVATVGEDYGTDVFWNHAKSIPWRFGGAAAVITATGVANWNWGSSPFRFKREGWFGEDTANGGMDKLGHAYSAFVLTEFFTDGINQSFPANRSTATSAALLSMGLMTYIEVFDGFSKDHGFSHEDLVMDAAGALFSVARRSIPGLREKLDFRLLFQPSGDTIRALMSCFPKPHCDRNGHTFRSPITDYKSQRYLFALKLAGFGRLADTPLRLLELHGGYYARGFTREEEERGDPIRRRLFVGAGLNVSQLLFPGRPGGVGKAVKSVLEYLQVPYTAVHSN